MVAVSQRSSYRGRQMHRSSHVGGRKVASQPQASDRHAAALNALIRSILCVSGAELIRNSQGEKRA